MTISKKPGPVDPTGTPADNEQTLKEKAERYQTLLMKSSEGIVLVDPQTRTVIEASERFAAILGYTPEELTGKSVYAFILGSKEDIDRYYEEKLPLFGELATEIRRFIRKDGRLVDVERSGSLVSHAGKAVFMINIRDITEERKAAQDLKQAYGALSKSEARLRAIFDNAAAGIAVVGRDRRLQEYNRLFAEMFGYDQADLSSFDPVGFIHPEERVELERLLAAVWQDKLPYCRMEKRCLTRQGFAFWTDISITPIHDNNEAIEAAVWMIHDITAQKDMQLRLREKSFRDELTGIYNRTYFSEQMRQADCGGNGPAAIIVGDLDGLKLVNDFLGHTAGDVLLKEAAKLLQAAVRDRDIVARIGGDEFAILLPGASWTAAANICRRLRQTMEEYNARAATTVIHMSLGFAAREGEQRPLEEVFQQADTAMYEQKAIRHDAVKAQIKQFFDQKRSFALYHDGTVQRETGLVNESSVSLADLIDIDDLQKVQDAFAEATGIASVITDITGKPITRPSNFCRLCADIIRATPLGQKNCMHSDAMLGRPSQEGYRIQPCLSGGLLDGGTSIYAGDRHIANWLVGQVLHDYDWDRLMAYAREIGADEQAFAQALREVPRMSYERLEKICRCLSLIAGKLSRLGLQSLRQAREIEKRIQTEVALRLSEEKFSKAFQTSPDSIKLARMRDGKYLEVNEGFTVMTGYTAEEALGRTSLELGIWDDSEQRQAMVDELKRHREVTNFETCLRIKDGSRKTVLLSAKVIEINEEECMLSIVRDITDRKQAEQFMQEEQAKLEELHSELQNAYQSTIEGWAMALELRDLESAGHSRRVTEMTIRLAGILGIDSGRSEHIRRGALLHDIGKMSIPDHILLKPGPLTDSEWQIMQLHPVHAKRLLLPIDFLKQAIDIPYCHHEKWDGTGYPQGLKGGEIPLAARIFAVVDIFEALSVDRPYRKAWPRDQIIEYLDSISGKHLDPYILKRFLDHLSVVLPEGWQDR